MGCLWTSPERCIWQTVLDRRRMGIRCNQLPRDWALRRALFCIRAYCGSWRAARKIRGVLGGHVSLCRIVRRVSSARILAIHFGARHGFLACCDYFVLRLRTDPFEEWRRELAWPAGRRCHRVLFLPDSAAYRKSLVRRRIPCLVGLGRDFFL